MTEFNLPFGYYVCFALISGLIIGSFLNVVIHRVPLGQSIIYPGSHCPSCGKSLRAIDNIPLLSYAMLRGRCRQCRQRISPVYPFVELATGALFAAIMIKTGPSWEAALEMAFAGLMLVLVVIDARRRLLPNVITYPAFVFALAAAALRAGWGAPPDYSFDFSIIFTTQAAAFQPVRAALLGGLLLAIAAPVFWLLDQLDLLLYNKYFDWEETNDEKEVEDIADQNPKASEPVEVDAAERRYRRTIYGSMMMGLIAGLSWAVAVMINGGQSPQAYQQAYSGLSSAWAGAMVGGVPIWWLRAFYFLARGVEGMGLGDIKLLAIIGAFLGWQGAFGVLLLGSIAGSLIGAILMWRSGNRLKTALPFGVCLGLAAIFVLLVK